MEDTQPLMGLRLEGPRNKVYSLIFTEETPEQAAAIMELGYRLEDWGWDYYD